MPYGILTAVFIGLASLAYNAFFVVYPMQHALVLRFGAPTRVPISTEGLNFKAPFIDDVVYLDRRILELDTPSQEIIALDQKRLVVDAFTRYRITDPLRFFQALRSQQGANSRIGALQNSAMRSVLGKVPLSTIVSEKRAELMLEIKAQLDAEVRNDGVEIIDVKIRAADLPEANSLAVFKRMETERQQEAAQFRAEGEEQARRIRSAADRDVVVVLSEAHRDANQIRGDGDAKRNNIFAEAYGRNTEFFDFYRSMRAYETGISESPGQMVISPDSEFMKYFKAPKN